MAFVFLLAMFVHRVQNNLRIAHWFAIAVPDHQKLQGGGCGFLSSHARQHSQNKESGNFLQVIHTLYSTEFRRTGVRSASPVPAAPACRWISLRFQLLLV